MRLPWLLSLAACGGPEPAEFTGEFPAALCGWVEECAFGEDEGPGAPEPYDCQAEVADFVAQAEGDPACEYDAGQARQCLAALEGTCEERTAIYYECKRVYRGDECPADLSTLL